MTNTPIIKAADRIRMILVNDFGAIDVPLLFFILRTFWIQKGGFYDFLVLLFLF